MQLRGAWDQVIGRVRGALDFASNDDLKKLAKKVDELAKTVEKLRARRQDQERRGGKSKSKPA